MLYLCNMILPNGVQILNEDEIQAMAEYAYRCIFHPHQWMGTIHHEPPRSLNPRYKEQPETWFPLCTECHDRMHNLPRLQRELELQQAKDTLWKFQRAE